MRIVERLKAWRQRPEWTDKAIVFLTLIIAAVGVAQTVIFSKQWKEMHSGGVDTHDLAVAAKAQADEAKVQADRATESAQYMRQLADQALAQAKATNRLAAEAGKSAEYARQLANTTSSELQTMQATAKNDQRAWVGQQNAVLTTYELGKVITITVNLSNTGRSPARHITYTATAGIFDIKSVPPFALDIPNPAWTGTSSIPPQGGYQIEVTTPNVLDQDAKDPIDRRDRVVWAWGTIHYEDIFGDGHITQFCAYSLDTTKNREAPKQGMLMHNCPSGNRHDEMD